ncbi:hypothetical protein Zm00014a_021339 [Zea mays]|uniref:Uncharacterized protein n=2 Tax=Zea mays TaxID=4577 RepID=A0A3L6FI98_MAIZE|nr:hypothetical protein Zm00014a_021339 [Zea mays]PWZ32538.1 hypothetical protein Zm00014a_021339 [Zea mays]
MCEDCVAAAVPEKALLSSMGQCDLDERDLACACCSVALESGFYWLSLLLTMSARHGSDCGHKQEEKARRPNGRRRSETRRASVALNVWQPQVVRGRQKQLVQQCTVPVDSRLSDLNMELKVCKQQIATYKNAYSKEKHKLNDREEALKRAKYHPLQDSHTSGTINEPRAKRKKLK